MVTEGKKQILSHMLGDLFPTRKLVVGRIVHYWGKLWGFANNGPPSLPNPSSPIPTSLIHSSPIPSSPNPTSIVNRDRGWQAYLCMHMGISSKQVTKLIHYGEFEQTTSDRYSTAIVSLSCCRQNWLNNLSNLARFVLLILLRMQNECSRLVQQTARATFG